ncbi:MAG: M1 family peptidase [Cytophagales bacterium]|nr:MAG: M1 family peptidase [Cytophagales bacterium]TAF62288.1 MAG: M1 family peptidase [Cytophagales bacterium]
MTFIQQISKLIFLLSLALLLWQCKTNQKGSPKNNFSGQGISLATDSTAETDGTDTVFYADTLHKKMAFYKVSSPKTFQLIHTKLEITPDWAQESILGRATLTVTPWFYEQDSLVLDAKGFDIKQIKIDNQVVSNFTNTGRHLIIKLNKPFVKGKNYEVFIHYSTTPKLLTERNHPSKAEENGLYFINAQKQTPNKPQQIWTQGQTGNNSCWFPTFDQPNIRTTQEMHITVENRFKSLSNGKLIESKQNADGTRTDIWKQEVPHPPYLFMLAVGEFAKITESWKDKEVAYYVENAYKEDSKAIFGHTPEMIGFFSKLFGYEFPWDKYSQVVVRDYISGAMENTSASVFMEGLQMEKRCLIDDHWDDIIAHELVHQWFGDLVTCESWGNLTLNEAFANYGEYLWTDYKYGRDEADAHRSLELESYLNEAETKRRPIVRYYYDTDDELFDNHSYAKGYLVLHYLRSIIGDEAFFATLTHYLKQNAHKSVELANLRMAFEETSGLDLTLFFEQWLLTAGHPELKVTHEYKNNRVYLHVEQAQIEALSTTFQIPFEVEIWENNQARIEKSTITNKKQTFSWPLSSTAASCVVFDPRGLIPARITHDKDLKEYAFQVKNGRYFATKYQAFKPLYAAFPSEQAQYACLDAMQDPSHQIRQAGCEGFLEPVEKLVPSAVDLLKKAFNTDPSSGVRMLALDGLLAQNAMEDMLIDRALQDTSYYVMSSGIYALALTKGPEARPIVEKYEHYNEKHLVAIIANFYSQLRIEGKYEWFIEKLNRVSGSELSYLLQPFTTYLMGSEGAVLDKGMVFLVQMAQKNNYFQTRKDAIQALSLLESFSNKPAALIADLKKNEKDKRVLEWIDYLGH